MRLEAKKYKDGWMLWKVYLGFIYLPVTYRDYGAGSFLPKKFKTWNKLQTVKRRLEGE